MKKLLFAVAITATGLVSANNKISKNLTIKKVALEDNCVHVKLSCKIEYDICNFKGTTEQLINTVINAENQNCPGPKINKLEQDVNP